MVRDPSAPAMPTLGSTIAGKYVLEAEIGKGGMGAVFSARHLKLSKRVAIKVMLAGAGDQAALGRFINEGRAAANIQSEHVVRVDDVDEENGYAYMVLELLEGEDLAKVVARAPMGRLAPPVAVAYVLQALQGVTEAHRLGIVHRDLKPSNLFLARRPDGTAIVKVLDFGISKQQASSPLAASPNVLTSTQAVLGSPFYMSPEQLRSSKHVDQRADIWAIGVILYELITGSLPYEGETLGALFAAVLETEPVPLARRVPGVPEALDRIVLRCLERRAERRFQTVAELAQALAPFADAQLPRLSERPPMPAIIAPTLVETNNGGWQRTGAATGIAARPPVALVLVLGVVFAGVLGTAAVFVLRRTVFRTPAAQLAPAVASDAPPPAPVTPVTPVAPAPTEPPPPASASTEPIASAAPSATAPAVRTAPRGSASGRSMPLPPPATTSTGTLQTTR